MYDNFANDFYSYKLRRDARWVFNDYPRKRLYNFGCNKNRAQIKLRFYHGVIKMEIQISAYLIVDGIHVRSWRWFYWETVLCVGRSLSLCVLRRIRISIFCRIWLGFLYNATHTDLHWNYFSLCWMHMFKLKSRFSSHWSFIRFLFLQWFSVVKNYMYFTNAFYS